MAHSVVQCRLITVMLRTEYHMQFSMICHTTYSQSWSPRGHVLGLGLEAQVLGLVSSCLDSNSAYSYVFCCQNVICMCCHIMMMSCTLSDSEEQ